ncbi:hypothetical protein HPC49_21300 [Pyxidicoccus fallax]|uniref:Uncharacterized protein n=1 Tax=Pyxidicoccus fallax TaxID=394095 RepID=A0A848LQH3_9BACT|nr:hypothetical protein [Pyxidicoccus fallax]NMO20016.1 hypothetical protein [Pyxidicoccus fallax]NPC80750.1 hypothetical protein [Pyxidicoccus fallax]
MSMLHVPRLMRRRSRAFLLATTVLLTGAAPEKSQELVLGSAGGEPPIEAVALPCKKGERALRVRRGDAKRTATLSEDWDTLPCDVAKAGSPERSDAPRWDWSGGEEGTSTELRLRAVDLAGGPTALLITLQKGFDHVHRQHALFVPHAEGVTRAWEGDEGMGPSYSSVELHDGRLLFSKTLDTGLYGGEDSADTWALTEVRWDAGRKKVVERPAEAWGVFLRAEDSLSEAREAERPLQERCKDSALLVVETNDFPRLTPDKWVVANFLPSREGAEAALKRLQACAPKAYVKRVQ